jgi:hypothetical protein
MQETIVRQTTYIRQVTVACPGSGLNDCGADFACKGTYAVNADLFLFQISLSSGSGRSAPAFFDASIDEDIGCGLMLREHLLLVKASCRLHAARSQMIDVKAKVQPRSGAILTHLGAGTAGLVTLASVPDERRLH